MFEGAVGADARIAPVRAELGQEDH